ncbi:hypothetical protein FIBSPDRAFT_878174, partial [Athelia psychrophila]
TVHCTQRSITSSHQSYSHFELKHTPIRVHHDIAVLAKWRSQLARRCRSIEASTPRFRALSLLLGVCSSLRGDELPFPLLEEEEI